ncbi:Threonine--tRNA ligase 2; cytoplasmic [Camelus dromedarius]|uniref:threonine--tRNA ligase n=1 Tax=Camelus dromedarius TaxID=9838 RepID=A0A5N4CDU7_CAMDR|nr:Threonine--tRNA ligase 2; cytoplasmic [Camelus dromedarius]
MAAEPWRRRPWLRPGAQEEDIRWLWAEVHRLKDEQLNAPDRCQAEGPCLTREPPPSQSQEKDIKKEKESEPYSELKNQPDFVKERLKLFEILKKEHQLLLAIYDKKGDTSNVITVRVADGKTVEGEAWKTTPYDVAAEISQELAEDTVVAKVNGELWDLDRPLEGDSTLELLLFDNEEAQAVST